MWKAICKSYGLQAPDAFWAATDEEIDKDYNGIGPEKMPDLFGNYLKRIGVPDSEINNLAMVLRKVLSDTFNLFQPGTVVHDFRFGHSDGTRTGFDLANDDDLANCKIIVNATYPFWSSSQALDWELEEARRCSCRG